ncbi:hypothetical protein COCC4DRAFT_54873 [Bipolaris maydis ATCC 48331]|uniref:Uncharacterized protein n=1 Tax=Cochliobolus heterostrophus (strain C4 / ATCC 48331 / race T) TaxID=665024 RepID=N4WW78_COCH4|nr:uncharacterized protein COCC4DRAFT_54873 [Bipolaris maydis ATCC 48331]ENH98625.1 hypothetical protein COCC4DRAFT_54873 [Bipolaris maydis ATCC 48331]KAJ5052560.1 hypothetical protein J3E74DRAFT_412078 [Bipolaris maydis]KAJ6192238.1 hypothetical protein J3E72DRAFT_380021 [Bipolaris maydis]
MPLSTGNETPYEEKLIPGEKQTYNRMINLKVAEIQKDHLFTWKELDKDTQERVQNEIIRKLEEQKLPEAKPETTRKEPWSAATLVPSESPPYDPVRDAAAQHQILLLNAQKRGPNLEG